MSTLLVIDDDRSVRHIVEQAFVDDGVRVFGEASAEAGLDAIKECKPDVVLLDIVLPKVSGLEVFKQIREIRSEEHTSELQSPYDIVCRLLLEKKKKYNILSL